MIWGVDLAASQPVAHALLVLGTVAAAGLAAGAASWRGVRLGSAGVLFAGLVAGELGAVLDADVLDFVREFGLVLFVFTIGLQLGPGFFASLRAQGLVLNAVALSVVLAGAIAAGVLPVLAGLDPLVALGLFSGATTNTPSLGAIQQVLATLPGVGADRAALPSLAYAVSYPAGIVGIIATLVLLRALLRIDVAHEVERFRSAQDRHVVPLMRRSLRIDNVNLDGLRLAECPGRRETRVIVSRVRPAGEVAVRTATEETMLHVGDVILAVGTAADLDQFQRIVGSASSEDLLEAPGPVVSRRVVVTHRDVLDRTVGELGLTALYGVAVTRVTRAGLEMTAVPDLRLQFGDVLHVVGEAPALGKAAAALGDSLKALAETHFVPVFVGLALGVLAGVVPLTLPGAPAPVRLGLAGGPLVVAILLGRLGHLGPLVWHMPASVNLAFRELGITLFLACVGLRAGSAFFDTVLTPQGLAWIGAAALITMVPLLAAGVLARLVLGLDYVTLSGLLSGSMTDPPALAFASTVTGSDAPALAYATVYPLTMLLRILCAQILTFVLIAP